MVPPCDTSLIDRADLTISRLPMTKCLFFPKEIDCPYADKVTILKEMARNMRVFANAALGIGWHRGRFGFCEEDSMEEEFL
jgi:hypothetical protein